jgi:hypothetical protein
VNDGIRQSLGAVVMLLGMCVGCCLSGLAVMSVEPPGDTAGMAPVTPEGARSLYLWAVGFAISGAVIVWLGSMLSRSKSGPPAPPRRPGTDPAVLRRRWKRTGLTALIVLLFGSGFWCFNCFVESAPLRIRQDELPIALLWSFAAAITLAALVHAYSALRGR